MNAAPPIRLTTGTRQRWVIKLGGSLARSRHLRQWLERLVDAGPLVIVPGGGRFADQVREAQASWGFDDSRAHHMALLAMEQYGLMLQALQPGLRLAASPVDLDRALAGNQAAIWLPTAMVLADREIRQDWTVTSDSLAAWLCRAVDADALGLVKSRPCPAHADIPGLIEDGALDRAFAEFAAGLRAPVWWLFEAEADRWLAQQQGALTGLAPIRHGVA